MRRSTTSLTLYESLLAVHVWRCFPVKRVVAFRVSPNYQVDQAPHPVCVSHHLHHASGNGWLLRDTDIYPQWLPLLGVASVRTYVCCVRGVQVRAHNKQDMLCSKMQNTASSRDLFGFWGLSVTKPDAKRLSVRTPVSAGCRARCAVERSTAQCPAAKQCLHDAHLWLGDPRLCGRQREVA